MEPMKFLGTIPSQRAQHSVLGVPAEVWELHLHSLWLLWVGIPVPVWGGKTGASGTAERASLLPALAKMLP